MEEHLAEKKIEQESVAEYNAKQKAKGEDDLPTIISKMSIDQPSEAMERKAKEI